MDLERLSDQELLVLARETPAAPGPLPSPAYPGLLVGEARVMVPR
jgi:hypothetical protein